MAKDKRKDLVVSILLVIVSVLLAFVLVGAYTFAWFTSQDSASVTFAFGGAVLVNVADENNQLNDDEPLTVNYSGTFLLPGTKLSPQFYALFEQSSTSAIFRAKVNTWVEGLSPEKNNYLNSLFATELVNKIDSSWAMGGDGWYYFLGGAALPGMVMTQTASASGLSAPVYGTTNANYTAVTGYRTVEGENTVLASVYSGAGPVALPFLNQSFRIPTIINSDYAAGVIHIEFTVQALQDYLVDTTTDENILPTLANARSIFNSIEY